MSLCQIGGVGGDLICDHAVFDVFLVRQAEVFFRRDVAEHCRAEPPDHRRADGAGDVIVTGRDVGNERAERIKRGLFADLKLLAHVLFDECIGTWPGPSIITCTSCFQAIFSQLAQRLQFGELRGVVGVGGAARPKPVAERKGDVVGLHDLADLFEVFVEEVLAMVRQAPLRHNRSAARNDPGDSIGGQRNVA